MAAPEFESKFMKKLDYMQRPYSDFSGVTNAVANTQTLFNHGLTDSVGNPMVPAFIDYSPNVATGILYEVSANHSATQADIRATTASVAFRARAWA
jgi:hypothetical protein